MKSADIKAEFIRLRAEGISYSGIAGQLHISKSTCTEWERDLQSNIDKLRKDKLAELYTSYGMTKEARIKRLGDTLSKIDSKLAEADLGSVDPVKLLDYKLKYMEALKEEYAGISTPIRTDNIEAKDILTALGDLLNRVRAGDITTEQAQKEAGVLAHLLKAFEDVELQAKLNSLEAIVEGRDR